tara:strand:- start:546 stop:716 length:171 start_codon:yes stop_codon:yes gene_type:complete
MVLWKEIIIMYKTHNDVPTSVVDFVLTASGESDIKKVPLEDINNFINDMEKLYGAR